MAALVIAGAFSNVSLSAFVVAVSSAVLAVLMRNTHSGEVDPVDELTQRVRERNRHPVRYALTHPVESLRRILR